jgi:hypothetical protein
MKTDGVLIVVGILGAFAVGASVVYLTRRSEGPVMPVLKPVPVSSPTPGNQLNPNPTPGNQPLPSPTPGSGLAPVPGGINPVIGSQPNPQQAGVMPAACAEYRNTEAGEVRFYVFEKDGWRYLERHVANLGCPTLDSWGYRMNGVAPRLIDREPVPAGATTDQVNAAFQRLQDRNKGWEQ